MEPQVIATLIWLEGSGFGGLGLKEVMSEEM